jgi:CheY-like chemotaxis protein
VVWHIADPSVHHVVLRLPRMCLDLGLPVMDGFELGERLRANPALNGIMLIAP